MWAANQYSGTVSRIDPRRDQVVASVHVGGGLTSLAVGGGRIWVGVSADGADHRGGTLVIVTPLGFGSGQRANPAFVDPAFYFSAPTVNDREVEFVSQRLHNYEYNPVWGFLADQSWLG